VTRAMNWPDSQLGERGWAVVYRTDRASLDRFEPGQPLDLANAWCVRAFDGRQEARWWADTRTWLTVDVPKDGIEVRYRLWGERVTVPADGANVVLVDRQVGAVPVWIASDIRTTGAAVLVAVEQIAQDEYGNRYIADEILVSVEIDKGASE
jgi:hypothetical protein